MDASTLGEIMEATKSSDVSAGGFRLTRMRGGAVALNRTRVTDAGLVVEDVVMYTSPGAVTTRRAS